MILTAPALPAAGGGEGFESPTPEIFWQPLFEVGGIVVTNQMAWAAIVTAVVSIVLVVLSRKAAVVPSKGQWLLEASTTSRATAWPAT